MGGTTAPGHAQTSSVARAEQVNQMAGARPIPGFIVTTSLTKGVIDYDHGVYCYTHPQGERRLRLSRAEGSGQDLLTGAGAEIPAQTGFLPGSLKSPSGTCVSS